MARTVISVPYRLYWGTTKEDKKRDWENHIPSRWGLDEEWLKREYLLHGTESRNYTYPTHEWFNYAHRVGRRDARDQLRPHIIQGENCEFDESHYRRKLKSVWWSIY